MTTWPKIDKFEELSPFIHRQQSLVGPTIRRIGSLDNLRGAFLRDALVHTTLLNRHSGEHHQFGDGTVYVQEGDP